MLFDLKNLSCTSSVFCVALNWYSTLGRKHMCCDVPQYFILDQKVCLVVGSLIWQILALEPPPDYILHNRVWNFPDIFWKKKSFWETHCFSPYPQGWEECCDAAVSHLLRTCLSRSPKDQATSLAQAGGPELSLPQDTSRLKRHITLLCDRIGKGGRLTLCSEANVQVPAQVQSLVAPGELEMYRKKLEKL